MDRRSSRPKHLRPHLALFQLHQHSNITPCWQISLCSRSCRKCYHQQCATCPSAATTLSSRIQNHARLPSITRQWACWWLRMGDEPQGEEIYNKDTGTQQTDLAHVYVYWQYKPMAPIDSRHEHATKVEHKKGVRSKEMDAKCRKWVVADRAYCWDSAPSVSIKGTANGDEQLCYKTIYITVSTNHYKTKTTSNISAIFLLNLMQQNQLHRWLIDTSYTLSLFANTLSLRLSSLP